MTVEIGSRCIYGYARNTAGRVAESHHPVMGNGVESTLFVHDKIHEVSIAEGILKSPVCVVNFNVATSGVPYASSADENSSFAGRGIVVVVNSPGFGYRPFFGQYQLSCSAARPATRMKRKLMGRMNFDVFMI